MKIKLFFKNLGAIILANLLMGCASQLTQQGDAVAQEANPLGLDTTNSPQSSASKLGQFASRQQEHMYKILVAELAQLRGHYVLAADNFFEVAKQIRDGHLAERATRNALYAKKYNLATQAVRLWVALAPENSKARHILGEMLLRQQRTEEAVANLETMLNALKNDPQQRRQVMETMFLQQKDQAGVLELMKQLVAKHQNDSLTLLTYARLLVQTNQLDNAIKILEKLFKIAPDDAQAVPLYAYILDKQNQPEQALQWMKQLLSKYPEQSEWRLMYARMLADQEQFEESIKQFQLLLSKDPQNSDILYALGILTLQIEQLSAAKKYFMELIKVGERVDIAYYFLGQIAQEAKDLDQARSWYNQVEEGPNYLNAQARVALILAEQKRLDEAIEHLKSVAVDNDEDKLTLLQFEAELLIEKERYQQAMAAYDQALKLATDNTEILYMRALLAEKMGLIPIVERDLRRVLALEPKNYNALNALGYTLSVHTDRYEEAYELIKQALALSPEDYYILDSMGWVLYKMGNYAEAIAYLRKAQAKQNDPEIAAHLGEVLWHSGDQRAAQEVWDKALEQFQENQQLKQLIESLIP